MTRTVLAPHFLGKGKIAFTERLVADPGAGELLLRIEANALCGTDREQFFEGSDVVPGHEAAGTVIASGPDVLVVEGTRGAVYLMDYCSRCRSCLLGHTNQCLAKRNDMGFTADGGYGPYELVSETNFFPVPATVSAVDATLLLDVMGTSGHALTRLSRAREDITSLYIGGAGPIGLGLLVMAKIKLGNDTPVYISDISRWRLDFAASLGGIPVDAADDSATARLPEMDAAVDSTGKQRAREAAMRVLGQRGVLACVGHGEALTLSVTEDLIATERTVMGSEYFRYDEMAANLDILQEHHDQLARIITHRMPVHDLEAAFELFLAGETGKVVVEQDPT